MPTVTGVIETALYVDDLERSGRFYEEIFGFRLLMAEERMRAYSVADRQVLLLFKTGGSTRPSPMHGGLIPPHDGRPWERGLKEMGWHSEAGCPVFSQPRWPLDWADHAGVLGDLLAREVRA